METNPKNSRVYELLTTVMDPELHIDIVSLGLIYGVQESRTRVKVEMTLTTPGCPLAPVIDRMIKEALLPLGKQVELELVWDPPWTMDLMTEEAKLTLGIV